MPQISVWSCISGMLNIPKPSSKPSAYNSSLITRRETTIFCHSESWHSTSRRHKCYNKSTKDSKYLSQLTMTAHQWSILHSAQVLPIKAGSAIGWSIRQIVFFLLRRAQPIFRSLNVKWHVPHALAAVSAYPPVYWHVLQNKKTNCSLSHVLLRHQTRKLHAHVHTLQICEIIIVCVCVL